MGKKRTPKSHCQYSDGTYVKLPHKVIDCENYRMLSDAARGLLVDAARLFNGRNNGDIALTETLMRPLGWRGKRKLIQSRHELEHYGFLRVTRQGGKHKVPTLYALTWVNIQSCNGQHDEPPTDKPTEDFLVDKPRWVREKREAPTFPTIETQVQPGDHTGSPRGPISG